MKLRDLNARFKRHRREQVDPTKFVDGVLSPSGWWRDYYDTVDTLAEAQGIWFDCPCQKCQSSEYGMSVLIGFEGRGCPPGTFSQGANGQDTRWAIIGGSGLDDLQLSPSIQVRSGCNWHGFVGHNGVPAGEAA